MAKHIVGDNSDTDEFFSLLWEPRQCSRTDEHKGHTWQTDESPGSTQWWCHGFYPVWSPDDVEEFLK